MLAVADTNHLSELDRNPQAASDFESQRLDRGMEVFTTIISVQEITKGWLALLNRSLPPAQQVPVYMRFQRSVEVLRDWDILPFDREAAAQLQLLQRKRLKIGTMDLKIAAICLAHQAALLTRNVRDFASIPGLRVENWLD